MTRVLPFLFLIPACMGANLAYSTFLQGNFTPAVMASDAQGGVYLAGSTVMLAPQANVFTQPSRAIVAKLDAQGARYVYFKDFGLTSITTATAIAADSAGNAFITGYTSDPSFPVTASPFATAPVADGVDQRSFVTKLSPDGKVVFSVLLGGSARNIAEGIALTPEGRILIGGYGFGPGFAATPGAYSVGSTSNPRFLMELDPSATSIVFCATGISGTSIVVDAAGDIYLAGSSDFNYPTTPGAYQTKISQFSTCGVTPCFFTEFGLHVTKIDSAATKLIYSTGLPMVGVALRQTSGPHMLAVDAAGNAFVAGAPVVLPSYSNAVMKLDPTGSSVLFSVPVGASGVQIDSSGAVYATGFVLALQNPGSPAPIAPSPPPAALSWVPQACWPNNVVATREAYVVKLDADSGAVQDGQWIAGSAPEVSDIVLSGGKVWIAGGTPAPDVPYTPGALAPPSIAPGLLTGGFLTAVDFSQSGGTPVIACVLDQGNMTHVGAIAPGQLISLFGANLDGASVSFDGTPAPMLYVSASQVNLAVPAVAGAATVMQLTVNGVHTVRQFPVTASNLNLFADLSKEVACGTTPAGAAFQPLVTNADGTLNSCANPAKNGSTVSFYAHGAGSASFSAQDFEFGFYRPCNGTVDSVAAAQAGSISPYVDKVDTSVALSFANCSVAYQVFAERVTVSYGGKVAGPFALPAGIGGTGGTPETPMVVWVTP